MVSVGVQTDLTCSRTCHTMQVVSLEPEIRWMPQWSIDKQDTMSGGEGYKNIISVVLMFISCLESRHSIRLPMCLMCCPTLFPLTREVTRRLLSQWPPLKSNLPSWETTNSPAVTSTPGAKGPDRKRWVLGEGSKEADNAVEENDERAAEEMCQTCTCLTLCLTLWGP